MTTDLVEFLRQRLADDERLARAAGGGEDREGAGSWFRECPIDTLPADEQGEHSGYCCTVEGDIAIYPEGGHDRAQAEHISAWDPARVLAEVAAKRAILDEHGPDEKFPEWCRRCDGMKRHDHRTGVDRPCPTLRLLAQPYDGHPDYQAAWSPNTVTS